MAVMEAQGPLGSASISEGAAAEDVVVVAGISDKRIRGLAAVMSSVGGCQVRFHQGGGLGSGALVISANTKIEISPSVFGWADTDAGSSLLMNCTGDIEGLVRYQIID